jgi:hypothetical protein
LYLWCFVCSGECFLYVVVLVEQLLHVVGHLVDLVRADEGELALEAARGGAHRGQRGGGVLQRAGRKGSLVQIERLVGKLIALKTQRERER